ncbi:hypothetical protein O4106_21860 [Rhodococcus pyridinivorans]|uniref:glycine-rich domain-containing protein n=1 Tax=Rhodococcus pyridinivorans TaxID=103816 RepID=UPI0022B44028|nr:hypothetical protein [Rhodococcus pyridinivorans]MCZ4649471.1 hypothetical protein [Rhodococcus pyridinivorans]
MTYPVGGAPDGSFRIGNVRDAQDLNEASVKSIIRGKNLPPWENAQGAKETNLASGGYVQGEVGRLDNRIDELLFGEGKAQLFTYSTSTVWPKPANCRKVVAIIIGGASGGGRRNATTGTRVDIHGLGGFSGGWTEVEYNPLDLPDQVEVVVGSGGVGSSTLGAYGAPGTASSFNGVTAGGAAANGYGVGNKPFRIRGGRGGYEEETGTDSEGNTTYRDVAGATGGMGTYAEGGRGASDRGTHGGDGVGLEIGQTGMGSGGGGGAVGKYNFTSTSLDGGRGGGGGWPSGPGGGGGAGIPGIFGPNSYPGNGGSGAGGAVFVIAYLETAAPT